MNARQPPTAPPEPLLPNLLAPLTPADELRRFVDGERVTAQALATAETYEKTAERGIEDLDKVIAKQRENLAELRGFRRPVVSLVLFRAVRSQLHSNLERRKTMAKKLKEHAQKLTRARSELDGLRAMIQVFRKTADGAQVLPFVRRGG